MRRFITQLLEEKHGITILPGTKGQCPFCHHPTFSVKLDDTLGKCFHPGCGKYITSAPNSSGFYEIMETIFHDWHTELLNLKNKPRKHAYAYLVQDRALHSLVIDKSMIGVVPISFDVAAKFAPEVKRLKKEISTPKKGRPSKKQETLKNRHLFLVEMRDKLAAMVSTKSGWLAFFYTDVHHRITSIKLREPYTKNIRYFKPNKNMAGVFGHGYFLPDIPEWANGYDDLLIVTEGEFNQLQLQSLFTHYGEVLNNIPGFIHACSVGGVFNADYQTIRNIGQKPVICFDNDVSGRGFTLVERALPTMGVSACTVPDPHSDIDEFLRSFGNNHNNAFAEVNKRIKNRKFYPRTYDGIKEEILQIRNWQKVKEHNIHIEVSEVIKKDLWERGTLYFDGRFGYHFSKENNQLKPVSFDDCNFQCLLDNYKINRSEKLYKYIIEDIKVEARKHGKRTCIHQFSYYDEDNFTLYLSNQANQIFRISPEVPVELVPNGTDGILFLDGPDNVPIQYIESQKYFSLNLFKDIIIKPVNFISDVLSVNEQRITLMIWFFSLFFESILPTKPLLLLVGKTWTGKTTALRKIGLLLFGKKFEVMSLPDKQSDFEVAITNTHLIVFDNADTPRKWLLDLIATTTTGSKIIKRKLYTDNDLVEFATRSFLSFTARTPHFQRDDIATRLLLLKLTSLKTKKGEKILQNEVLQNRNQIMTEVINVLHKIVKEIKKTEDTQIPLNFRMADFASLAYKMTLPPRIVNTILSKLNYVQNLFLAQKEKTILGLLNIWVPQNEDVEKTTHQLFDDLLEISDQEGITFPCSKSPNGLGQILSNEFGFLQQFFDVTRRSGHSGETFWTFKLYK